MVSNLKSKRYFSSTAPRKDPLTGLSVATASSIPILPLVLVITVITGIGVILYYTHTPSIEKTMWHELKLASFYDFLQKIGTMIPAELQNYNDTILQTYCEAVESKIILEGQIGVQGIIDMKKHLIGISSDMGTLEQLNEMYVLLLREFHNYDIPWALNYLNRF